MSVVPETMGRGGWYDVGARMGIEDGPTPRRAPVDVRGRVRACGIGPNLGNVLKNWTNWFPQNPLPDLPATFGLDPSGEIAVVGSAVTGLKAGDRVYVNPGRSCGSCRACREGEDRKSTRLNSSH